MTPEEALRQSLDNLALRVTTSRGGYVGGGQPHATIPSDPGAIEQLAQSLAARLPALPVPAPEHAEVTCCYFTHEFEQPHPGAALPVPALEAAPRSPDAAEVRRATYDSVLRGLRSEDQTLQVRAIIASVETDRDRGEAAPRSPEPDPLRGKDISMAEHSDTRSHCPTCGEWRDSPTSDCASCGFAASPETPEAGIDARLEQAYTLLISATPALFRAHRDSPNPTARHLNAQLHDLTVDWLRDYQAATGRDDQGLVRLSGEARETPEGDR